MNSKEMMKLLSLTLNKFWSFAFNALYSIYTCCKHLTHLKQRLFPKSQQQKYEDSRNMRSEMSLPFKVMRVTTLLEGNTNPRKHVVLRGSELERAVQRGRSWEVELERVVERESWDERDGERLRPERSMKRFKSKKRWVLVEMERDGEKGRDRERWRELKHRSKDASMEKRLRRNIWRLRHKGESYV